MEKIERNPGQWVRGLGSTDPALPTDMETVIYSVFYFDGNYQNNGTASLQHFQAIEKFIFYYKETVEESWGSNVHPLSNISRKQ